MLSNFYRDYPYTLTAELLIIIDYGNSVVLYCAVIKFHFLDCKNMVAMYLDRWRIKNGRFLTITEIQQKEIASGNTEKKMYQRSASKREDDKTPHSKEE